MKLILYLVLSFAAVFAATQATAHEEHKKDMSDAEMAQMHAAKSSIATATEHGAHGEMDTQTLAPTNQSEESIADMSRVASFGDFLGRLHPFVVHFPIALLLTAALAEFLLAVRPALGLEKTIHFLIAFGAMGALAAAIAGWFAAGWRLTDRSELLGLHRWMGTGIALASLAAWWLSPRASHSRIRLRLLIAVIGMALLAQGYLGGEMVFGTNHLGV